MDFPADPTTAPMMDYVQAMYRLGYMVWNIYVPTGVSPLHILFASLFMFLCGISCTFSHDNFGRGTKLLMVAIAITVVLDTLDVAMGLGVHIYVGILHALAIGIIIYAVVDVVFPPFQADYLCTLLFLALWSVAYFGYESNPVWVSTPQGFAENLNFSAMLFGTAHGGDDYFSPMLTTTMIFLGATVGKTLYKGKKSALPDYFPTSWMRPLEFIGRHTLSIYVLHQPILLLMLFAIVAPAGYTIAGI